MSVTDKTILLGNQQDDVENRQAAMVLEEVFAALKEAEHNPVVQLVGYLVSGEPTYITSLHDARKIISGIERDELVEEMVRFYVKHREL